MTTKVIRALWLLNHSTARKFEVAALRAMGIEVFTPKKFPQNVSFRSASVDYSIDETLTIPSDDLERLNETDWYGVPSEQDWAVANKYFDLAFFITHSPESFQSLTRNFTGALIWRGYGLNMPLTYTDLRSLVDPHARALEPLGRRFWFGHAYEKLPKVEDDFFQRRAIYLPLGLPDSNVRDLWTGSNKKIYFVCPDILANKYYEEIFHKFKEDFGGLPYSIAGSQPFKVSDQNVLGYVTSEEHAQNMQQYAVMFYHSCEPCHVHYHPFEAIRAGMPLVFMAGGMLDSLGGKDLPGRCKSVAEARRKIERILGGDNKLIQNIKKRQVRLLDALDPKDCGEIWKQNIPRILRDLEISRIPRPQYLKKKKKILILVPVEYRGGSLRGAKLLAEAILRGSSASGDEVDLVFAHVDKPEYYSKEDFDDLPEAVSVRSFSWRMVGAAHAKRAMSYAGRGSWSVKESHYYVPDDGISHFLDCDLWIVVSDRLSHPLLPLRPYVCMVYDYLQRYQPFDDSGFDLPFLKAAQLAEAVLVTTDFTGRDACQYAGISSERIRKLPMLVPRFKRPAQVCTPESDYFLWTTNTGQHKNHLNAVRALEIYYDELGGKLNCKVTGVNTSDFLKSKLPHLERAIKTIKSSKSLMGHMVFAGELAEAAYRNTLQKAAFLWHAGRIDNGTFSVVEARQFGVPALTSDYPAMREMNEQFELQLRWMDANNPENMAERLKEMEQRYIAIKNELAAMPSKIDDCMSDSAPAYWNVVREFL